MATKIPGFFWYDVTTRDPKAAAAFYSSVMGWAAQDSGVPGQTYTIFSKGPNPIGGLMSFPEGSPPTGVQSCWTGYIGVDDVDAYTKRVKAAGGAIHREPWEIPGVGRFAIVADPQGAVFMLMRGFSDQPPPQVAANTPGHVAWHELHADDPAKAFAFYADLFGWTKGEAMDMGPGGIYQLFKFGGGEPVGGMMTRTPDAPGSFWLYYFQVEALGAALARVTAGGGKICSEPHQVPGDAWIAPCLDPQGGAFALVADKR
ncbi:MAG TPA: VOC family protein [Methylibium sp.]